MANLAQSFVTAIPSTEEDMRDICNEIVSRNKSVANFRSQIENLEHLIGVMEEFLERQNKKVAEEFADDEDDIVNHDCPHCKKKTAAEDGEISPEEAKDTPALNELDDEPHECGDDCDCEDCKAKKVNVEEDVVEEDAFKSLGPCKVLTLTTTHTIDTTHAPGQKNTTLSVTKLQVEEDRIRFKFNTFEHVLPTQMKSHKAAVVNEAHEFNTQTVRLVLDFGGKSYPALVDLVEGEADVLTVGDDLFEALRKDEADVSSK